jgi:hypothetical protein
MEKLALQSTMYYSYNAFEARDSPLLDRWDQVAVVSSCAELQTADQSVVHHVLAQIVAVEVVHLYVALHPKEVALQFVVEADKNSRRFASA